MRGSLRNCSSVRVLLAVLLFGIGPRCFGADEIFDARGLNAKRGSENPLPFEHIDPLTGNLTLTFTDLTLPGDGGFDLRLQRTYNSKIYADIRTSSALDSDSWAGVGWTFHLGRVASTQGDAPLAVEMPDGSSHKLYASFVGDSNKFVTRDYWLYDRSTTTPKLLLTNGVVYTFGKVVAFGSGRYYRYPTKIEDAFGNYVTITYPNPTLAQVPDAFATITQYVGGTSRVITFATETSGTRTRLRTMTYAGRTWTYGYVSSNEVSKSLLTSVTPPANSPAWSYAYDMTSAVKHELVGVTAPWGGTIAYTYGTQGGGISGALSSPFYLGSTVPVMSRVVTTRTTGGTDVVAGTHTYMYAQGTVRNQSIFTRPLACCTNASGNEQSVVTTYTFLGVGNASATGSVWKIGLLDTREVTQGGVVMESEHLVWRPPATGTADLISPANETVGNNQDAGIYAAVVASQTTTRGPQTYMTTNTYHSQAYTATGPNFNDYGRPYQVVETGDAGTRTTVLAYKYGFTPYIRDRVDSESVTVGSETFGSSYVYSTATGFKTNETIRGITTTFTPTSDGRGNVWKVTDAHSHTRVFTYSYGRANRSQTPTYNPLWTRVINADGTVQSETRRGFTTGFGYDDLMRPTSVTPPVGNATTTDYDLNESGRYYSRTTRGSSRVDVFVDGFGRPSSSRNSLGVATDTSYDACGQKTYESVPYCLGGYLSCATGTVNSGAQSRFDGLGRVVRRTNTADSSFVTYTYSNGLDVTITDEEARPTTQYWSAFGDPTSAQLGSVTDARGHTWLYTYNALGSLTKVTAPVGGVRKWEYFPTTGLLKNEIHPESGTVSYTYDTSGRLSTRTDPAFGQTVFGYDSDDRVTGLDRPGTADDTTQAWDASNNRTTLNTPAVQSSFGFDAANRLTSRTDTVDARVFTTVYTPDANDNIGQIDYPSGLKVKYTFDGENRISDVRKLGASTAWANTFAYHPSGAASSLTAGNAMTHGQTFTSRYWPLALTSGAVSLTYQTYDKVGNPKTVVDHAVPVTETFAYDAVDRLETTQGRWGSGSFTYSDDGNRKTKVVAGVTTTYAVSTSTGRLDTVTGAEPDSFTYDANGNTKTAATGSRTFTYTTENMLKTSTAGGVTTTYVYDGDNQRTSKTTGTDTRYYVHGPSGQILSEFSVCGAGVERVRDYVYAGSRLLSVVRETPTVGFVAATSTALEQAGGVAQIAVQLTTTGGCATTSEVTVLYSTANGTAGAGTDYLPALGGKLTFPAGTANGATQMLSVALVNDEAMEPQETFSVSLSAFSGVTLGLTTSHTVTIQDDDVPTVSFVSAGSSVTENGAWASSPQVKVVTKDGQAVPAGVTVGYQTTNGTAVAGSDYTAATGTLSLAGLPSQGTKAINPPPTILSDTLAEGDETFGLSLTNAVMCRIDTPATQTVTIKDDDVAATKTVWGTESPGGTITYTVTMRRPGTGAPGTTSVQFADTVASDLALTDATASTGSVTRTGNTANWTGSIPASGSATVTLTATINAGTAGKRVSNQGTVTFDGNGDGALEASVLTDDPDLPGPANPTMFQVGTGAADYYPLPACRVVDTRNATGPYGGPALTPNADPQLDRVFTVRGKCGVPATAKAVVANVTVTGPTTGGFLGFHAPGLLAKAAAVNYATSQTRGNNAQVMLDDTGQVAVSCTQSSGSVHMILDIAGYYE